MVIASTLMIMLSLFLVSDTSIKADVSSFTFTAVGDFGANDNTTAVLDTIAASGASFHLALGDLSYSELQPESSWCDYVKSHVGADYPFELIAGNHDSGQIAAGGNITNFAACLPDRMGNIVGTYAKEYFFDYPATAPLARFILISPRIDFNPEGSNLYTAGSVHYNWVHDTIDSARASGIPWVIVAMHKNCLGAGRHSCDVERDLFNLLIGKKVDLILHGHDHSYQRGKQLAHSPSCTAIAAGSFNSNCVVDDGSDNLYTKDSGSVVLIAGMGGRTLYDIHTFDPEAEYFAKLMGGNISPTYGIVRFAVSATALTAEFVHASGGTFSDNFSIEKERFTIWLPLVSAVKILDRHSATETTGVFGHWLRSFTPVSVM